MALAAGSRIGAYEITGALGAGGMGEVYRARDTRLKRDVALKILPPAVAGDRDRVVRFEREAELLAALNHPNIAQIHGVEDADGSLALVMELVEGEDLAERISRGPIPLDEALSIARQVADALEAAHERGIVHRDLKPANIKVRPDGTVKVLDFGLARGTPPAGTATPDLTQSPTLLSPTMTAAGVILGTAAYMSPEQARGKQVDRRADIWAFGAVLFEMLTGSRPFGGDDVTDTIASVLRNEPDWQRLPADVPGVVQTLIRRCLEKDPHRRPPHLSVATFLLSGGVGTTSSASPVAPATPLGRTRLIAVAAISLLVGAAGASGVTWWLGAGQRRAAPQGPTRFTLAIDTGGESWINLTDRPFVMSPDGRAVVYRAMVDGLPRLFIRSLDSLEPRQLAASLLVRTPFFSPDSQWLAYFDGPAIKKVRVSGGPPVTIAPVTSGGLLGASWGDDDTIVYAVAASGTKGANGYAGLMTVPASGGEPKELTTFDPARGEGPPAYPFVLPQSSGVLFRTSSAGRAASAEGRLMVLVRASGERRELAPSGGAAEYVDGHVVYSDTQGRLHSMPFDLSALRQSGPDSPLADHAYVPPVGQPMFSTARSGALAVVPPVEGPLTNIRSLVWVTRQGREEPIAAPARAYASARLSPDGTRVALDIRDEENDIWIWSLASGVLSRLTSGPTLDMSPIWTADGRRIVWASTRDNTNPTLYVQAADGTGSPTRLSTLGIAFPGSVTPDGRSVLFFNGAFIVQRPLAAEGAEEQILGPSQTLLTPEVSPDGRWLAYQSNESGQPEVYVRPYPNIEGGRWQISTQRGTRPAWSRNGRELFFLDGADRLSVVPVAVTGNTLMPGAPRRVLERAYYPGFTSRGSNIRGYDVSPDGQKFLMIKGTAEGSSSKSELAIVTNWPPPS